MCSPPLCAPSVSWTSKSVRNLVLQVSCHRFKAQRCVFEDALTTTARRVPLTDGRLVVHYSPVGNPGNGADPGMQKWTRVAFDEASAALGGFNLIHMESVSVALSDFMNVTVPVIPSWHGVM